MSSENSAEKSTFAVHFDGFTYSIAEVAAAAFDSVWNRMADDGRVDAHDSAEYKRVKERFHGMMLWFAVEGFITTAAAYPASSFVGVQWITGKVF